SWRLALALAVPAAVLAAWQLPPRRLGGGDQGAGLADDRGPELRLLTLNVERGQARAELLVSALLDCRADVLVAQEVTPEAVAWLDKAGLPELFPHGVVDARPDSAGAAIWSRWPLTALAPVPGLVSAAPRAVLHVGGRPVTLTCVHLPPPVAGRARRWQAELAQLRSLPRTTAGPQLVAGDFNATRDHRPFRRLLAAGYRDCADAAARRRWPAVTWPSGGLRLPVMRLDHVLASRGDFTVAQSRTVRVAGTDHRGVLTVLRVRE
ncbi:MAG: endonuclease/exonuclease/phosphatase family protein, partial [Streptosporangiaceae bacterium]